MHVCHVQVMSKLMLAAIDAKVKKLAEYSSKTARTVRLAPHVLPITNHSLFILHILLLFHTNLLLLLHLYTLCT